jgi:hypothetical protein
MDDEAQDPMATALGALFSTDCVVLDLGDRQGWTSYIDFIRPDELADEDAMKGVDAFGRRFLAFKCTVRTTTGEQPPAVRRLFTTVFQRYQSDDDLYHTAGHYGTHLLTTTGGADVAQIELVGELLRTGRVDLTVEAMTRLRVGYRDFRDIERLDPATVDAVTLGWAEGEKTPPQSPMRRCSYGRETPFGCQNEMGAEGA